MTNYEKIKTMSIEEMAEFLDPIITDCKACPNYKTCHLEYGCCASSLEAWLESEVEDNG